MMRLRWLRSAFLLAALAGAFAASSSAQSARILVAQAETEGNPEKQVTLLCKAADLEPANKEYRKNCDLSKAALLAGDKQRLKDAQDASDAGRPIQARRFAGMVTSLDPELHRQAEQLLNKLANPGAANNAAAANPPASNPPPNPATAKEPSQAATPAQATPTSDSGNLAAAKSAPQSVADPAHQQGKSVAAANIPQKLPPVSPPAQKLQPEVSPEEKKKRLLEESAVAMSRNDLDTASRRLKQVLDLDPANAVALQRQHEIAAALSKDPVQLEKTLREAIVAFYASDFDTAESRFNRYLGADGGKKKGAAYFYLGATETTLALLNDAAKRSARTKEAREDFKQARLAGYQPLDKYVSARVLDAWKSAGM